MKISSNEKREIVNWLKTKEKPNISASLFTKAKKMKYADGKLVYDGKMLIVKEDINAFLTLMYKKYPFGKEKLYKTLTERYGGFSRADVESFLANSQTNQLHTVPKVQKVHQPIVTKSVGERWQTDLIDLNDIKGYNHQYRYVLTIIDLFSKYAWAFALTKKDGDRVYLKFEKLFEEHKPHILQSDNGSEFITTKLKKLLEDKGIKQILSSAYSPRSNGAIERFNRTLKQMIFKLITENNSKHFVTLLDEIVKNYNNSYHSTIKNIPSKVFFSESKRLITKTGKNIVEKAEKMIDNDKPLIKKGDQVRISKMTEADARKNKFEKKYVQNWSDSLFEVVSVSRINKNYKLKNIETGEVLSKRYYQDQLLKIDKNKLIKAEKVKETRVDTGKTIGITKIKAKIRSIAI